MEVDTGDTSMPSTANNNDDRPPHASGSTTVAEAAAIANMENVLEMIGPAFARDPAFYRSLFYSAIPQGVLLAFVALAFFNCYVALGRATWNSDTYGAALQGTATLEPIQLGNGEWWYVGLLSGAGFVVGLLKVIWNTILPNHKLPKPLPSFAVDIRQLHAEDLLLPIPMLVCSALSIGLGASAGPEAALGITGTTIGSLVFGRNYKNPNSNGDQQDCDQEEGDEDDAESITAVEVTTTPPTSNNSDRNSSTAMSKCCLPDLSDESRLCALDGIAAAFGALFPSQILAPLIAMELGFGVWSRNNYFSKQFVELVVRMGISSTVSYTIFTSLEDATLLHQLDLPFAGEDVFPVTRPMDMLSALIMGILCGIIGLIAFILLAGFAKLGKTLEAKIDALGQKKLGLPEDVLGTIMTPTIGGIFVGMLCKYDPLLFGDGADQMGPIITLGAELGTSHVVATGFLKLIAVSISLGFGFVGGQFFPLLFAGTCTGVVIHLVIADVPAILSISCCMVAVPDAILPALFSLTLLASVMLALGGAAASPVFLACVMSYATCIGSGMIQKLIQKALANSSKES